MVDTMPAQIWIIRHGEKPDNDSDPSLTAQGVTRSEEIASLFPQRYQIDFLFASAPSAASYRPIQTVLPLLVALDTTGSVPFNMQFPDKLAKEVRDELRKPQYSGKNVFICWHHGEIPALAKELAKGYTVTGGTPPGSGIPTEWDGKTIYDRIWSLAYTPDGKGGGTVFFTDTSENLPMDG